MVIPWKTQNNILGSLVDDTGDNNVMVQAQIRKAIVVFYRDAELLLCKHFAFSKVKHYLKHVLPVALHGCGAWIFKQGTLILLHGFETRMRKLMFGFKKHRKMDWITWHVTATNKAKELFFKMANTSITVKYLQRLLKFAHTTFSEKNMCAPLDSPQEGCELEKTRCIGRRVR